MIWKKMFTSPRDETEQKRDEKSVEEAETSLNGAEEKRGAFPEPQVEDARGIQEEGKSRSVELTIKITIHEESQIGRTALLLAATTSSDTENRMKRDAVEYSTIIRKLCKALFRDSSRLFSMS